MNWTFTEPGWLWLLAGVPLYFFAFLLASLFRTEKVPSLNLWKGYASGEFSSSALWSPDRWIPALLFSLVLGGTALVLADPSPTSSQPVLRRHFFIDLSASMRTKTSNGQSRLDRALSLLHTVQQREQDVRSIWKMTLLGPKTRSFQGSPTAVLDRLDSLQPTEVELNPVTNLQNAVEEKKSKGRWSTFLLSDDPDIRSDILPAQIQPVPIGTPVANTGIVSLYGERRKNRISLYAEIKHSGPDQRHLTVSVIPEEMNKPLSTRDVTLQSGGHRSLTLTLPLKYLPEGARLQISGKGVDGLDSDNSVYFTGTTPFRMFVQTIGKSNDNLSAVLKSLAGVARQPNKRSHSPDLKIYYHQNPGNDHGERENSNEETKPDENEVPFVVIAPAKPEESVSYGRRRVRMENVPTGNHPIMRNVRLEQVRFFDVRPFVLQEPKESSPRVSLIGTDRHSLVYLNSRSPESIWFSFDPFWRGEKSITNWPVAVDAGGSFIIFWENLFQYFHTWNLPNFGDLVYWKTGQVPMKRSGFNENIQEQLVGKQFRTGLDPVEIRNRVYPYPRNLLSEHESNTWKVPSSSSSLEDLMKVPSTSVQREERSFTGILTIGVLVLFFSGLVALLFL